MSQIHNRLTPLPTTECYGGVWVLLRVKIALRTFSNLHNTAYFIHIV